MTDDFEIKWLDNTPKSKEKYNRIVERVAFSNVLQEWNYGDIKAASENSVAVRGIIFGDDVEVGTIQMLVKKKLGIPICVRVNRGPQLVGGYDTPENHMSVMKLAKGGSRFHYLPFVYAPNMESTPQNLEYVTRFGWKQWSEFGFSTGIIDLSESEEDIRRGFEGKWRNQLKSAEKNNLKIKMGMDRYGEMLDLYEKSQDEKRYVGIDRTVMIGLSGLLEMPLMPLYIENEDGEIMAFDIFYHTKNFAMYFIGWNDNEGRKVYANNILLYEALKHFKNSGVRWFDLGGIDYIQTEENAFFKDGMRPRHIQYLGEFLRI